jgi:hypothetical protein
LDGANTVRLPGLLNWLTMSSLLLANLATATNVDSVGVACAVATMDTGGGVLWLSPQAAKKLAVAAKTRAWKYLIFIMSSPL